LVGKVGILAAEVVLAEKEEIEELEELEAEV
jgi:hypothetical protein